MPDLIMVVEDELTLRETLVYNLVHQGYTVESAADGQTAVEMARRLKPELIILDLMLPRRSGVDVLKELRKEKSTPVLVLTAKGQLESKVEVLNIGADDYLTKPFALAECIARVRSLLRRSQMDKPSNTLSADTLELDQIQHIVRRAGVVIDLTVKEFKLLEYLLRNKNTVLTRSAIIEHIWEITFDTGTNVLDVYMTRLRKKVDDDHEVKLIHTIRGVGYILKDDSA